MSDSPFLEDQAIRLAIEDDSDALDRVLEQFLDGELARLSHGARLLAEACLDHQIRRVNRRVLAASRAAAASGPGEP